MGEKIAVRTPTKKDNEIVQYNEFRRGNFWEHAGKTILRDMMMDEGETCIRIMDGMGYADKDYYEEDGFEIISVAEYLKRFGTKKDKYTIKIKDRDKFDFDRVIKEVREADPKTAGFVLTIKKGVAAVVLYNDFLGQFARGMAIVAYETLSSEWGYARSVSVGTTGALCRTSGVTRQARALFISREGIPATIKEIEAAKALIKNPEIKINVRIL